MKTTNLLALCCSLVAARAGELHVYFGNLHSHTAYSDGSGTPTDAYNYAKNTAKLDFIAITEHNHKSAETSAVEKNNDSIALHHALYNGPQAGSVINAAKKSATPKFVALYGQEFSTISGGNHVNVFDVGEVIDESVVPNKHFDDLVKWMGTHKDSFGNAPILQFNHPDRGQRDDHVEYGADEFGSEANWISKLGKHAALISIQNGPSHTSKINQPATLDTVEAYLYYLSRGFKLAPTCDQDNHYKNWGATTQARTAVIAEQLTKAALLEAMRARHVYATQDKNLRIIFKVNDHLCGDEISTGQGAGDTLNVQYSIVDDDEPGADYQIEVWTGKVGGPEAKKAGPATSVSGDNGPSAMKPLSGIKSPGHGGYLMFRVVQDVDHGSSDIAWTAPIWF